MYKRNYSYSGIRSPLLRISHAHLFSHDGRLLKR